MVIAETSKDGRIRNFVSVQMKDGKHGPVARGIQKLVGMPTGGERPRLALAVTNDAAGYKVRVVKDCAVGVHQRITQFSPFMDRAWGFRGCMTGDSPRK